jgi:hypothetical protein
VDVPVGALTQTSSGSFGIPELVALAGQGRLRVPTFQRSFEWDADDVRQLFDSLYRGFPIGTVLLWQRPGEPETISFGPIELEVGAAADALWVVDGQQRITSLFGALSPDHQGTDSRFEVYFDLETQRFVNPRRGVVSSRSVPVREVLETRSLLNWTRQHEADLGPGDVDLVDRLGGVLRDYRVPAYIVTGEDQNLLREIFDRVNTAGKPIKRAQVFHALFARDGVPGSPGSVRDELRHTGFGLIEENRIVQSLLAIRGGDVQRDIRDEFGPDEDPVDWFDRTEQALVRAIEFLQSEGVPHVLLMPRAAPVPVLAAFFFLHPQPSPWNLRLLSRWLWRGWVHGWGGSEAGPAVRKAVNLVNPVKGRPERAPSEYEAVSRLLASVPDRYLPQLTLTGFRTDKATSRLILLALASLGPTAPDGTPLDLAAALDERGVQAVTEFVPDKRSHAAARGFWPDPEDVPVRGTSSEALPSHLLSVEMVDSLGDADTFVRRRGAALDRLVHEFLANKVEFGALVRPPLNDLVATGNAEDD